MKNQTFVDEDLANRLNARIDFLRKCAEEEFEYKIEELFISYELTNEENVEFKIYGKSINRILLKLNIEKLIKNEKAILKDILPRKFINLIISIFHKEEKIAVYSNQWFRIASKFGYKRIKKRNSLETNKPDELFEYSCKCNTCRYSIEEHFDIVKNSDGGRYLFCENCKELIKYTFEHNAEVIGA